MGIYDRDYYREDSRWHNPFARSQATEQGKAGTLRERVTVATRSAGENAAALAKINNTLAAMVSATKESA